MVPLIITALSLGLIHTLLGPDHYVPFIALAKSNRWSLRKTVTISSLCGLAHCLSSVVIGFIGISLGLAVGRLELLEGVRGDFASYLMIALGLVYLAWSLKQFLRKRKHAHLHTHGNMVHTHTHTHGNDHLHVHENRKKSATLSWGLFALFLFGPCEPLIPLLMYPAAKGSMAATVAVATVFTVTTVVTMLVAVMIGYKGLAVFQNSRLTRYADLFASGAIIICGCLILVGLA